MTDAYVPQTPAEEQQNTPSYPPVHPSAGYMPEEVQQAPEQQSYQQQMPQETQNTQDSPERPPTQGQQTSNNETDAQQRQYANLPQGPQPEQLVIEWDAPSRPFKKRNRQYYTTIAIIVGLVCAILFFAGQFLPIAVVVAIAFLAYVLSAVPPEMVTHRVTTYGVRAEDNLYYWEELGRFWLSDKYGQRLLHIEVARFPFQLTLVIDAQFEDELVEIFSTVLLFEQPVPTAFDKAAKWLQEKIPLDNES